LGKYAEQRNEENIMAVHGLGRENQTEKTVSENLSVT
jgi:hypothetical protein